MLARAGGRWTALRAGGAALVVWGLGGGKLVLGAVQVLFGVRERGFCTSAVLESPVLDNAMSSISFPLIRSQPTAFRFVGKR